MGYGGSMTNDEPARIQLTIDSPEARAAFTESLRLVAAIRGVAASEDWATNASELGRVVSEVMGDEEDPYEAVAQRVAYMIQGLALVGTFATAIAAAEAGCDPADIDARIERHLADLS
jgi:hypothetical protein